MEYRFKTYKKSDIITGHLKMGGRNAAGEEIRANSLYFTKDGVPWIGVMGEYHFARDDAAHWRRELQKMKAGGVSIVSTYVFWIYHEETEGVFDFSGNNDIRTFLLTARDVGLEIFLRPGPWVNAECRNGGFPDWLLKKDCRRRTNDPAYMAYVERFWRRLFEEARDIPLLGIQIENELIDQPEHIAKLKALLLEIGFRAPIFSATGWNGAGGAKLPLDEVIPVFGGYPEAPWERHKDRLPPSKHFFFNPMRNDADIGADLMVRPSPDGWRLPYERYPFATCEMGGGVQVGHHRRPIIDPMDVYTLSLVKLGCGNNLIGYYMYHGGSNAIGKHSCFNQDYCPIVNYDFQAPLSQYGEIRASYRLLSLLNLFAADFGNVLAPMEMVEAEQTVSRDDTCSLRYSLRTDGEGGFVFVNHYQRLDELKDIRGAVFDTGVVRFPPVDVLGRNCFFMPFNLKMGSCVLEYATAQPLCIVGNTFFFVEIEGIAPSYRFRGREARMVRAGEDSCFEEAGIRIVTLTKEQALYARKLNGKLYIGQNEDLMDADGRLECVSGEQVFSYRLWQDDRFAFHTHEGDKTEKPCAVLKRKACAQPFEIPEEYARYLGKGKPGPVAWYRLSVDGAQGFIEIADRFDVGQLYANRMLVADQFYYGKPWRLPALMLYGKECYLALSQYEGDFYREF